MTYHRARKQPSFWQDLGDYLLGELQAVLFTLVLCLVGMFFVASLFVGMYHLLRSALLFLIH